MLRAMSVSWAVRGATIVDRITLEVREGETLGVIGPNGSGKSTFLRLLAGILAPSGGSILLEGEAMDRLPRRHIAQRLAFVEQQAETIERLKAREAVELGRTAWLSSLAPWSVEDTRIVDEALAAVDMSGMDERIWHTLSGGERQRIHIARALAQDPRILILDEPTNHLDILHQLTILELVRSLRRTTVIALHDLNQAMGCDRLAVLDRGRLVALGAPPEILGGALLSEVFGVRSTILVDPADGRRILRFTT